MGETKYFGFTIECILLFNKNCLEINKIFIYAKTSKPQIISPHINIYIKS